MTCTVSGGTLNPTHVLTPHVACFCDESFNLFSMVVWEKCYGEVGSVTWVMLKI